ncbi:DSD1 family PLP-dependent enzyme [Shewanella sp. VB17]|uniref:DSD1 family PLP-dependent enzyme n=1 Tax=Shewanella sp. VB17 TaxID=2739432 RepID=UPI001565F575|nr:DSD1 family PLP-dependent enzyme [Shewanella sp. VB17]NRD72535.1 DSD1 family PLP-dependent enzyme [Shewanella sp. VB17]
MDISQLDTPALIVDLDILESNIEEMQKRIDKLGLILRPHTKAHKIPAIAHMQIRSGAQGICTSKLGEAEVMAKGGIKDILITTPIAGSTKIQRLVNLHLNFPDCQFIQVIDHMYHVTEIAKVAIEAGVSIQLMIEVESGQQRCGVEVGNELVELIEHINQHEGVTYAGIQAYSGHLQHVKGYENRHVQARAAVVGLFNFIESTLKPKGLEPEIISGGGTGTFSAYQGLNYSEMQAGSYLFMDAAYCAIGDEFNPMQNKQFKTALKVVSTIISKPKSNRVVSDAGMKCLSIDLGMPVVDGDSSIRYQTGGDEHGILHLSEDSRRLEIGQQIVFIPSHCDTTLNNFDILYAVRDGKVLERWSIEGRGRSD